MAEQPFKVTIPPPPGRPSWKGGDNLPLIYLGWGRRDFAKNPLPVHYDLGTSYYILASGRVLLTAGEESRAIEGPTALLIDSDCPFGIQQARSERVEILVWVWRQRPALEQLRPKKGGFISLALRPQAMDSLEELHWRCRREVSVSDHCLPLTLSALRHLAEAEILRASCPSPATRDVRWELAHSWMMNNLSIHTPIPALCDYLGMSATSLHRFFREQTSHSPGAYFRQLKWAEARRLIDTEGWQLKAAAYHLGYRHPNDLSRAIRTKGT